MPLGSELEKQTDITKKQYQGLDKVYKFDEKEDDETMNKNQHLKKFNKSNLIYSGKYSFSKYYSIKKFNSPF